MSIFLTQAFYGNPLIEGEEVFYVYKGNFSMKRTNNVSFVDNAHDRVWFFKNEEDSKRCSIPRKEPEIEPELEF